MEGLKLMPLRAINGLILRVKNIGVKADALIHETGVQCLLHAEQHGDAMPFLRFTEALGKSVRRRGIIVWSETYSPIRINGDGKIGLMKADAKGFTAFNTDAANANPFWTLDAAAERTARPLSFEVLKGVLASYRRKIEAAKKGDNKFELQDDAASMLSYLDALNGVAIPVAVAA